MSTTKLQKEIHPEAPPFSRAKIFQTVFNKHLVSVQTFPVDEFPETAVEAWKRHFLVHVIDYMDVKNVLLFYMIEQSLQGTCK